MKLDVIENLNLKKNPFEYYSAEQEEEIDLYAARPKYFNTVLDKCKKRESYILFGFRGGGKTATRITAFKEIEATSNNLIIAAVTDYSDLPTKEIKNFKKIDIVKEIAFHITEAILVKLSTLPEDEREKRISNLTDDQLAAFKDITTNLYVNHKSPLKRGISANAIQSILTLTLKERLGAWLSKDNNALTNSIGGIINRLTKGAVKKSEFVEVWNEFIKQEEDYSKQIFEKLTSTAKSLGFDGIVVLLDKIDEHENTNTPEAASKIIESLLIQTDLMMIRDLGFVFFLWDRCKPILKEAKARLDKIKHSDIEWTKEQLQEVTQKRLSFYSGGKITSIEELFDGESKPKATEVYELCNNSPRELMRVLDKIVTENQNAETPLIDTDQLETGIQAYISDFIDSQETDVVSQIEKVGKLTFTSKDVQTAFKISNANANSKVKKWTTLGLTKSTGAHYSGNVGAPATTYELSDPRLIRHIKKVLTS